MNADHSKKHKGWTVNDVDFLRMLPLQLFRRAPEWITFFYAYCRSKEKSHN
jgi:hypothetical protein